MRAASAMFARVAGVCLHGTARDMTAPCGPVVFVCFLMSIRVGCVQAFDVVFVSAGTQLVEVAPPTPACGQTFRKISGRSGLGHADPVILANQRAPILIFGVIPNVSGTGIGAVR